MLLPPDADGEEKRFQGEGAVVEAEERPSDADEVQGGATGTGGRSGGGAVRPVGSWKEWRRCGTSWHTHERDARCV